MVKLSLFLRVEAKPGKEKEVADFFSSATELAKAERRTIAWFALRFGPSTFGVFDAFEDEAGRRAHLEGPIANALMAKGKELFVEMPKIEQIELLGAKLPG